MENFYIKKNEKYIPISFKDVLTKDWNNKLVIVKVGSDEVPATNEELEQTYDYISSADALDSLENTSFIVTMYNLQFEVLGDLKEIEEKYVSVRITGGDDLSKLGSLQKEAKKLLKNKTKKVVVLPIPLTVNEYKEVMEIKERCDIRKARRGS